MVCLRVAESVTPLRMFLPVNPETVGQLDASILMDPHKAQSRASTLGAL